MNLQSLSKRWLAAARLSKAVTGGFLQSVEAMRQHGKELPLQAQQLFITSALSDLRLTAEADEVGFMSPLFYAVGEIPRALARVKTGIEFEPTLRYLDDCLQEAITALEEWTGNDESMIEEVVSSLQRAFLLSLIITLTSHTFAVDWDDRWSQHHQRFLEGREKQDMPHYLEISTFTPQLQAGPGRVHVHHLHTAMRAGTTVWIAGAARQEVDQYPEYQSIILFAVVRVHACDLG